MTDASTLRTLLDQTSVPDVGFHVLPVPGHHGYRVGRGLEGSVVVLTPPESQPEPPTSLKRISLAPRIRCVVETPAQVEEIEAGVVEFRDDEPELVDHFLAVAGALIELVGDAPTPGSVASGMQRLLRLFAAPDRGRGSELGVWGELLVMTMAADPVVFVDAWHASVDDRFDFACEGERLEVKTTARAERIHRFSLHQLVPVDGCSQHIASLMTDETDSGTSISELVDQVRSRLATTPDRQMKVLEQVAAILGTDWPRTARHRFDATAAAASLRLMETSVIPRVPLGPPEVLAVDLTVDVSAVEPVADGPALGVLAASLLYPQG